MDKHVRLMLLGKIIVKTFKI